MQVFSKYLNWLLDSKLPFLWLYDFDPWDRYWNEHSITRYNTLSYWFSKFYSFVCHIHRLLTCYSALWFWGCSFLFPRSWKLDCLSSFSIIQSFTNHFDDFCHISPFLDYYLPMFLFNYLLYIILSETVSTKSFDLLLKFFF